MEVKRVERRRWAGVLVAGLVACGGNPIEGGGSGDASESTTTSGESTSATSTQTTQTDATTASDSVADTSAASNSSNATSMGTTNADGSSDATTTNGDATTSGSDGTTGGPKCMVEQGDSNCLKCVKHDCCDALETCAASIKCDCWVKCELVGGNESCNSSCMGSAPPAYDELLACAEPACSETCEVFD